MLQSLLQADDRLGRRHVDHKSHLHLYLHLHAAERYGRRYVDGLRVLPPVRLLTVTATARPCPSMSAPPELPLTTEAVVSIIGTR